MCPASLSCIFVSVSQSATDREIHTVRKKTFYTHIDAAILQLQSKMLALYGLIS